MTGLFYLIPAALLLGLFGLGAFLWALKNGQFDDLDGAAQRILLEDEPAPESDGESPRQAGATDATERNRLDT